MVLLRLLKPGRLCCRYAQAVLLGASLLFQGCVISAGSSLEGGVIADSHPDHYKAVFLECEWCDDSPLKAAIEEKGYLVINLSKNELTKRYEVPPDSIMRVACRASTSKDSGITMQTKARCVGSDLASGKEVFNVTSERNAVGLADYSANDAREVEALKDAIAQLPRSTNPTPSTEEFLASLPTQAAKLGGTYHGTAHYTVFGNCRGQPSGDYALAVPLIVEGGRYKALVPFPDRFYEYPQDTVASEGTSISGSKDYFIPLPGLKSRVMQSFQLTQTSPQTADFSATVTYLDYGSEYLTTGSLCGIQIAGKLERNAEASSYKAAEAFLNTEFESKYHGKNYKFFTVGRGG